MRQVTVLLGNRRVPGFLKAWQRPAGPNRPWRGLVSYTDTVHPGAPLPWMAKHPEPGMPLGYLQWLPADQIEPVDGDATPVPISGGYSPAHDPSGPDSPSLA